MNRFIDTREKVLFLLVPTFLLIMIISLVAPAVASAQVVINEFGSNVDPEWVELYNTDPNEVSLDGYTLSMGGASQQVVFTPSDTIAGNRYFVVQKGTTPGWNINWLNNDGDTITLTHTGGFSQTIRYGDNGGVCKPDSNTQSIGSFSDGQASEDKFDRFSVATKGTSNSGGTLNPCSTPTSTATSTPTPTPTPSPTLTPKPTPTKTPTPRASATSTPLVANQEPNDEEILGLREALQPSPTPGAESGGKPFPILAAGLVLVGGSFMGFGAYTFLKTRRARYT